MANSKRAEQWYRVYVGRDPHQKKLFFKEATRASRKSCLTTSGKMSRVDRVTGAGLAGQCDHRRAGFRRCHAGFSFDPAAVVQGTKRGDNERSLSSRLSIKMESTAEHRPNRRGLGPPRRWSELKKTNAHSQERGYSYFEKRRKKPARFRRG